MAGQKRTQTFNDTTQPDPNWSAWSPWTKNNLKPGCFFRWRTLQWTHSWDTRTDVALNDYLCCEPGWSLVGNKCYHPGPKRYYADGTPQPTAPEQMNATLCHDWLEGDLVHHSASWEQIEFQRMQLFGEYVSGDDKLPIPAKDVSKLGQNGAGYEVTELPEGFTGEPAKRAWIAPGHLFENESVVLRHRSPVHRIMVNGTSVDVAAQFFARDYPVGRHTVDLDMDVDGKLSAFQLVVRITPRVRFLHDFVCQQSRDESDAREVDFTVTLANQTNFDQFVRLDLRDLPDGWSGYLVNGPYVLLREHERVSVQVLAWAPNSSEAGEATPLAFTLAAAVVDEYDPRPVFTTFLLSESNATSAAEHHQM